MASNQTSTNNGKFSIASNLENQAGLEIKARDDFDYSKRAQWLRAAVLGANDGLVSTASLMVGIGAVKQDVKAMILTGFAGLVSGACSMAIGEYVSVYSQLEIELSQMKREKEKRVSRSKVEEEEDDDDDDEDGEDEEKEEKLPNPLQAGGASGLSFSIGAMVPLMAASFIKDYEVRLWVVVSTVSLGLMAFGWLGAVLGKAPVVRSSARVLLGGWLAMAITFGLTKLIGSCALH